MFLEQRNRGWGFGGKKSAQANKKRRKTLFKGTLPEQIKKQTLKGSPTTVRKDKKTKKKKNTSVGGLSSAGRGKPPRGKPNCGVGLTTRGGQRESSARKKKPEAKTNVLKKKKKGVDPSGKLKWKSVGICVRNSFRARRGLDPNGTAV